MQQWRDLSRPWRAFTIAFPILFFFFLVLLAEPVMALITALIWSAAVASIVRMRDRLRDRQP